MKQLSKRMAFYPMPIKGELFKAFIIRLASRNGRDELKEFMYAFGIPPVTKGIFMVGTPLYNRFLDVLSKSMEVDRELLGSYFVEESETQINRNLSTRHTLVSQPKICAKCLAKNHYIKAEWHLYYSTYCLEHECKLWKQCPQCGKSLNWDGKLLIGCTNCNLKWKDVSPIKFKLPPSQVAIAGAPPSKRKKLVDVILNNLNVSLRPFDASVQSPRDIEKYVDDLGPHIEYAFQLAHSKTTIATLKDARKKHWQSKIGGKSQLAIFNKLDAANDSLFDELIAANDDIFEGVEEQSCRTTQKSMIPKEASHMVLSAHRRLNCIPNIACLELSWPQLEDILKLNEKTINSFIKQGLFPGRMHLNSPKKVSPSRMDDVIKFFREIKKKALPPIATNIQSTSIDFIRWGDDTSLAKYKTNTKMLIEDVVSGKAPIFAPTFHDHLFEDFHFCTEYLNKRFGKIPTNTSSLHYLIKNSA